MQSKDNNNLVPFPGLEGRLLEKAISLLKEKKYNEALPLFEQLIDMYPDHPQAVHGMAVCYVEMGDYKEAEALTDRMLHHDIGDYYDVLKLHVTVLIQQRRYQQVTELLQAVLEEDNHIPTSIRQTLNQLSIFARRRMEEPQYENVTTDSTTDSKRANAIIDGDVSEQWGAAREALTKGDAESILAINTFLGADEGDPMVKSFLIDGLRERGFDESITINKDGQQVEVNPVHDELFYRSVSDRVKDSLNDMLASKNPTLFDQAVQLWDHFVLTTFPKALPTNNADVWAAVTAVYAHKMIGMDHDEEEWYELSGATSKEWASALEIIKSVEENPAE